MRSTRCEGLITVESVGEPDPVTVRLKDGTPVVLREMHPQDQPLLQELLESCSHTSLYHRFQFVTKRTCEIASRFCHVNDRSEKAIAAEIEFGGAKKLIGIGNLAADTHHRSAEVAILISDRWQRKGLGSVLANYCLELAHLWGVEEIVAVTTPDNRRVIAMARRRRFRTQFEQGTVEMSRKFHQKRKRLSNEAA